MMDEVVNRLTDRDRARLRELITEYSGLSEAAVPDNALEQAVARRLVENRLDSLADYWALLQMRPARDGEMTSLVRMITNKETFFFREKHHFNVLLSRVLPDLLTGDKRPLRLWSAGCATGEEPYSLAIALLEYQARRGQFVAEVVASDIDIHALEHARRGCYGPRSVRQLPEDLLQKYFFFDGQLYFIAPEVVDLVSFEVHNLSEDCCPPGLTDFDVIFCRNVTIYFDDEARERLNARLAASLREGGYLFVASAETIGHNRGRLELVSTDNTFLFRKGESQVEPGPLPPQPELPTSLRTRFAPQEMQPTPPVTTPQPIPLPAIDRPKDSVPLPAPSEPVSLLDRARNAFQSQDYDAALHELDRLSQKEAIWLEAYRLRGAILLQQSRLDEAEVACQTLLAHDPWHPDAHFLLGLVFRQQGQAGAAIESLKQAIYLQPTHRHAHFFLAETFRELGVADKARREYDNTLNILLHLPEEASDLNLVGLRDEILRQACLVNLKRLGGRLRPSLSGRQTS